MAKALTTLSPELSIQAVGIGLVPSKSSMTTEHVLMASELHAMATVKNN